MPKRKTINKSLEQSLEQTVRQYLAALEAYFEVLKKFHSRLAYNKVGLLDSCVGCLFSGTRQKFKIGQQTLDKLTQLAKPVKDAKRVLQKTGLHIDYNEFKPFKISEIILPNRVESKNIDKDNLKKLLNQITVIQSNILGFNKDIMEPEQVKKVNSDLYYNSAPHYFNKDGISQLDRLNREIATRYRFVKSPASSASSSISLTDSIDCVNLDEEKAQVSTSDLEMGSMISTAHIDVDSMPSGILEIIAGKKTRASIVGTPSTDTDLHVSANDNTVTP